MRNTVLNTAASLVAASLLTACAVGPDYRAPAVSAPAVFAQGVAPANAASSAATVDARWWENFGDPVLEALVRDALAHNHDVRIATARVAEARALRTEARWAFAPQGGIAGAFQRSQASEAETGGIPVPPTESWTTGLDAAWELDLFGRVRRGAEAADAEFAAAEADLRAVHVALLAEVAGNYFALRGTEASADLVRGQLAVLETGLKITRSRLDAGRGTPLDTARAEALLHETSALLPPLESDLAAYRHRLAVLTGQQPGTFALAPAHPAAVRAASVALALGSPAELLRRRPDILAAERRLAASTARVGVDTAALFPEVSVRGFFRFVGLESDDLGRSGSQAWAVAPSIRWSVLDHGRLRAQLAASRERTAGALALYERTVLLALEETETALARYRAALDRSASLQARWTASEQARALAARQLEAGAADPLDALDAERTALAAARDAIAARTAGQLSLVAVYRALGGGWAAGAAAL